MEHAYRHPIKATPKNTPILEHHPHPSFVFLETVSTFGMGTLPTKDNKSRTQIPQKDYRFLFGVDATNSFPLKLEHAPEKAKAFQQKLAVSS